MPGPYPEAVTRGQHDLARAGTVARRALGAACAVLAVAGCGSPTVVNTGEPWTPIETPAPPPQLPQYSTNSKLADASEYYVAAGAAKSYRFATPSGRWQCEIVPHRSAGCRPATSSRLSISGAPTAVPGPDGAPTAPNTIIIDADTDVRFIDAGEPATPEADADSAPAVATLPFGEVLVVAGFRCNVQEAIGVSCGSESSGKGFTFSADGYTSTYTDVPQ